MIREKIRYVFVCLLLGILAILYNEYITSVLFLSVIAFPVILWGIMQIVKRHVKVGLLIPERIVRKGEVFKIQIPLENPTILPVLKMQIRMAYQNQYTKRIWHEEVYATMNGKSHQSLEAELKSDYCGNLSVASFETIFSHSLDCLFVFFLVSFAVQKLISLMRSHWFYFWLLFLLLWETDLRKYL